MFKGKKFAAAALVSASLASHGGTAEAPAARIVYDYVEPDGAKYHAVFFEAGEFAEIHVYGDGRSDLNLVIYDPNGELVALSEGLGSQDAVGFAVPLSGDYVVSVGSYETAPLSDYQIEVFSI